MIERIGTTVGFGPREGFTGNAELDWFGGVEVSDLHFSIVAPRESQALEGNCAAAMAVSSINWVRAVMHLKLTKTRIANTG
jgi:hypothetical protein